MGDSKLQRREQEAKARDLDYLKHATNQPFDESNATRGLLKRHFHALFGTKRERKVKARGLA